MEVAHLIEAEARMTRDRVLTRHHPRHRLRPRPLHHRVGPHRRPRLGPSPTRREQNRNCFPN